jgi:hypothetical protein
MDAGNSLICGLDAFAEQFRAQADSAGLPASEHAIHFCLALGLQAAWALPAGAIVFERPSRSGTRTDLWVGEPYDLAIEVKYLRSHPPAASPHVPCTTTSSSPTSARSPSTRPAPARRARGRRRIRAVHRAVGQVRPPAEGRRNGIDHAVVARPTRRHADTPWQKAESHGPWRDLRTTLRWTSTIRGCSLFAWEATTGTGPSQTATDRSRPRMAGHVHRKN